MQKFVPDYMAKSMTDIDFSRLKKNGIRYVAFDADSTLVPWRGKALSSKTKLFLQSQRQLFENWCIASNRITNDLLPLAESIDAQVVRATLLTRKPQLRYFRRVINCFNAKPHEIAMVGDKLIADMWGAKRAGLVTIWVERIGRDGLWERLVHLRRIEGRLMRHYLKARQ